MLPGNVQGGAPPIPVVTPLEVEGTTPVVIAALVGPVTTEIPATVEKAEAACVVPGPELLFCPPEPPTVVSAVARAPLSSLRDPQAPNTNKPTASMPPDPGVAFHTDFPTFEPFRNETRSRRLPQTRARVPSRA